MILEFTFSAHNRYFLERILQIADLTKTKISYFLKPPKLLIECKENVEDFAKALDRYLYNSLFFEGVKVSNEKFLQNEIKNIPSSIYLCPDCLKEMLDENSNRYYYPFTMCRACGYQSSFLIKYPYERKNTLLNFFKPCEICEEEYKNSAFKKDFALISCADCGAPIKLLDKSGKKVFYANTKEEYKKIFEVLAGAILKGKKVVIKTFRGYKRFFKEKNEKSKALILKDTTKFLMLGIEKRALFSIERPEIFLTDENGKIVIASAVWDGFTTLLANELKSDVVYFDEELKEFDLKLDFDLPTTFYDAPKLFISKNYKAFRVGSESLFPKFTDSKDTIFFGDFLQYNGVIDKLEHFEKVVTDKIYTFKDDEIEHSNKINLNLADEMIKAVIKEHSLDSAIGVYFGEDVKFYYYKESLKEIFSFGRVYFDSTKGAVEKYKLKYPKRFELFEKEEGFLLKAARLLGFEGGFEEFNLFSHTFGGKGGVSIDCKVKKDGFDYNSFYSSIMSFVLAEAKKELIAYSIFESLGEFLSSQTVEIQRKTKIKNVVLAGAYITNSAFFSRFLRNVRDVKLPKEYPVDFVY